MKIRESIVFEMENQKMKVKTLKRSGCSSNVGHVREKLCSNKGHIITMITGKFHSGLQWSSCFVINLLNTSRSRFLERFTV